MKTNFPLKLLLKERENLRVSLIREQFIIIIIIILNPTHPQPPPSNLSSSQFDACLISGIYAVP